MEQAGPTEVKLPAAGSLPTEGIAGEAPLMQRRVRSMRTLLFAVVLVAIVPAALLALAFLISQYRDQVGASRNQSLARARALAAAVDSRLLQVESALYGLATASSLVDGELGAFQERANALLPLVGAMSIVVIDAQGRQVINTLLPFGSGLPVTGPNSPGREIFREGHPVARMAEASLLKQPIAVVGVPVRLGETVRFGLTAGIDTDRFAELIASQQLPEGWIAAIVDNRGVVAWRNILPERFVGKPATAALRAEMAKAPEGAFEGKSLDGVDTLTVYTRAPQTGWTIVFGIPRTEFYAGLVRSLLVLALGVAIVFALSAWAAWAWGGQLVRSTSALVKLSDEVATRDAVELPPLEFREARQLGEAMLRTSHLLHGAFSELAQKEARLRAMLDAAMDGVVVIDSSQHVVQSNAACSRMFGYAPDELAGRPVDMLLPQRARARHGDHVRGFTGNGEGPDIRSMGRIVRALHRDGHEFPVEASIARFEVDGQVFYVAIVRDVTERQRVEDELLRSNMELRQFAHAASHDMRSPLRSIIGLLSVVAQPQGSPHEGRKDEFVQRALKAARQLDRLTEDLLAYARLEGPVAAIAPVDLAQVMLECRALLESDIAESGAEIEVGPMPVVQGYAAQLTQLFHNLLGNAIKFRGERTPRIRVTATQQERGWRIDVTDNGIGIEPEYRERIFEIFQRLHTQAAIPGSGIGLAICRKIAQRHEGRVWVDSVLGEGSTFHVTLNEGEPLA